MRVGEVTGLQWSDVDFENEMIHVNRTLVYYDRGGEQRCGYSIHTPKTENGRRTIPMLPKVKEALLDEKREQAVFGITCKAEIDGCSDFVFLNRFGEVLNQSSLNKALRRIIRDCNYEVMDRANSDPDAVTLPKFSCHVLRHTFATRMCEAQVSISRQFSRFWAIRISARQWISMRMQRTV